MSEQYWKNACEELLDECGIAATGEQISQLARGLDGAAEVRHEYEGNPSYRVGRAPETNPLQAKCDMLQRALDAMARRYCVTVDAERLEISYHGHVGGTIYGTQREKI